jgi:hypothetical protein
MIWQTGNKPGSMKTTAAALLLAILPALARAADLSGAWIACDPASPWGHTLLSVNREGGSYRWTAEWGSSYAAGGAADLKKGVLVLRGCSSYSGNVTSGCDEKNPPVFSRLRKEDLERVRNSFGEADLRGARWVRVVGDGAAWQTLAGECKAIVAKKNALKEKSQ